MGTPHILLNPNMAPTGRIYSSPFAPSPLTPHKPLMKLM